MLMQTMPNKGYIFTFVAFFVALLICIIIGVTGPHVYDSRTVSAYDCPEGITIFDSNVCDGVDLSKNGSVWSGEIRNLDKLNQELLLVATLNNALYSSTGIEKEIEFIVTISGRNNDNEDWILLESSLEIHNRSIVCVDGSLFCRNSTLAHELFIKYSTFQFNVSILNAQSFLADVYFTVCIYFFFIFFFLIYFYF